MDGMGHGGFARGQTKDLRKVWGIQFLLLTLRSNLRGIYILRREIEKFKLHIISYGKKHI